jgi:hypothetical protein
MRDLAHIFSSWWGFVGNVSSSRGIKCLILTPILQVILNIRVTGVHSPKRLKGYLFESFEQSRTRFKTFHG